MNGTVADLACRCGLIRTHPQLCLTLLTGNVPISPPQEMPFCRGEQTANSSSSKNLGHPTRRQPLRHAAAAQALRRARGRAGLERERGAGGQGLSQAVAVLPPGQVERPGSADRLRTAQEGQGVPAQRAPAWSKGPLGSAPARLLRPHGAPGGSGEPGTPRARGRATGRPAMASGARASRLRSR